MKQWSPAVGPAPEHGGRVVRTAVGEGDQGPAASEAERVVSPGRIAAAQIDHLDRSRSAEPAKQGRTSDGQADLRLQLLVLEDVEAFGQSRIGHDRELQAPARPPAAQGRHVPERLQHVVDAFARSDEVGDNHDMADAIGPQFIRAGMGQRHLGVLSAVVGNQLGDHALAADLLIAGIGSNGLHAGARRLAVTRVRKERGNLAEHLFDRSLGIEGDLSIRRWPRRDDLVQQPPHSALKRLSTDQQDLVDERGCGFPVGLVELQEPFGRSGYA